MHITDYSHSIQLIYKDFTILILHSIKNCDTPWIVLPEDHYLEHCSPSTLEAMPQVISQPTVSHGHYSYRVKIINPKCKKDAIVRELHNFMDSLSQ